MEYIKIHEGTIEGIYSTNEKLGEEYKKIDINKFKGIVGDDVRLFNPDTWDYQSDEILVKEGLKLDIRGFWYNKENKSKVKVNNVWDEIPENHTQQVPKENQIWSEVYNSWLYPQGTDSEGNKIKSKDGE